MGQMITDYEKESRSERHKNKVSFVIEKVRHKSHLATRVPDITDNDGENQDQNWVI